MQRSFRAREFHRNVRLLLVGISLGVCIVPAISAWNSVPEHRGALAVVFSLPGWLLIYLSSRWLMAYYREFVAVDDDRVVCHKMSGRIEIPLTDVTKAKWLFPYPQIIFEWRSQQTSIPFELYDKAEQLWLVRFFHYHLRPEIQQDWERFCYYAALPLLQPNYDDDRAPGTDEIVINPRRRIDVSLLLLLGIGAAVGYWTSLITSESIVLIQLAVVLAIWLCVRTRFSRREIIYRDETLPRSPTLRWLVIFWILSWIWLLYITLVPGQNPPINKAEPIYILLPLVVVVLFVGRMLWIQRIYVEPKLKQRTEIRIAEAVQRWELLNLQDSSFSPYDDKT
ncbi:MAG: hypothetical protein WEB58_16115 [Planctomycetaceae bacterium]